ncbi:MAG: FAD-dependent oxidoreductase [Pseudomonadota bacterium]
MTELKTVQEAAREVPAIVKSDVVVVGGGSAGVGAAVSAARNGASVTLLERYPHLGGMASGGMVLVLDDMVNGQEITVTGIVMEMVERMKALGLAVYPPEEDRKTNWDVYRKWARWGAFDFHVPSQPEPIIFAVAFDPDGWKRVSNTLIQEAGINLRLHSWFSEPIIEDGAIKGVICETKMGRQAILGDVVIDATGDLDVASRAGAAHGTGAYIVTTVFRLGDVDTDKAEAFEWEHPDEFKAIDRAAKRIIGGSWARWWLKTPLPGIVWCNCPHMTGYDGMSVEHLTAAEFDGRGRIERLVAFVQKNLPGFENSYLLGTAEQIGVRQTRLLEGEYVVTKDDVVDRVHFPDTVCRGRDYYTPYRALLPRDVENLIVAGRHYSATPEAQRMSREIPPCMLQGEAVGVAAALALQGGVRLRDVDPAAIQRQMRKQGADPGDIPSANANVPIAAE